MGSRPTRAHKPCSRVGATIGSPLPAVGLDIHLCSLSGGYELPLLVGPAVGVPLHDLRPVAGRGAVDVGCQSVVVADDGVVAVTGGPQVPHLVGAAVGRPLLQLQAY